jgi:hypothetical protein
VYLAGRGIRQRREIPDQIGIVRLALRQVGRADRLSRGRRVLAVEECLEFREGGDDPAFDRRLAGGCSNGIQKGESSAFAYWAAATTLAMPGMIADGSTNPSAMPWRMFAMFSPK